MTICLYYMTGIFLIGVPMAKLSLWFYKTGEKLEDFPQGKKFLLKSIRNLLLPYFVFQRGGWFAENNPHTYGDCQAEIMTDIVDDKFIGSTNKLNEVKCMKYIIASSMFWPLRVVWNLFELCIGLIMGLLWIPFLIPSWLTVVILKLKPSTNS